VVTAAAVVSAVAYGNVFLGENSLDVRVYATIGAVSFLNFLAIALARQLYSFAALLKLRQQSASVARIWAVVVAMDLSLVFAFKIGAGVSRGAVGLFLVATPILLILSRVLYSSLLSRALSRGTLRNRRIVLVAERDELSRSEALSNIARAGYDISEVVTFGPEAGRGGALGKIGDKVIAIAKRQPVDSIVLLANWASSRTIEEICIPLRVLPLPVHLLPDHNVERLSRHGSAMLGGLTSAYMQRAPLSGGERLAKRAFDVFAAACGLLVLSPLLAMVALLIRVDSPGPVFFWQTRNGFNDRPFRIAKFRSMHVAEDGLKIRQATVNDARVTRVGRFLRKASIDELPQLWNVLRGDMSIVGPRPHAAAHNAEYQSLIGSYAFRHHVKPGLTGWAQVHGCRGETNTLEKMQRRVDYDLYYINHWSLWLDLRIILSTVRLMIRDPAAF
jgi:undecaprenyl-phosphate galactose phosphotransferase/putative colanic acid biosynthesis UDP-glucose lipid carrier transferase